ncbi:MAG: CRISPR-associated protein Cas5 [Microbacteriaceae bacterium]
MTAPLILRLAGPLQSWGGPIGEHKDADDEKIELRPTQRRPTRSGLLGLLRAALGCPRGEYPAWLEQTVFAVDVVEPGRVYWDFHMVTPPVEEVLHARLRLGALEPVGAALGKTVPQLRKLGEQLADQHARFLAKSDSAIDTHFQQAGAAVRNANGAGSTQGALRTKRVYLAGAEFRVTITHPDDERLEQLRQALEHPVFDVYLGRKACPATWPLLVDEDGEPAELTGQHRQDAA